MNLSYDFVPMGFVATPVQGKVYVDVGNAFCPGVLDHHHPGAPDACTAMLVLNHPEYVTSQIVDGHLTIIPHEYPDLDAVAGACFAKMHAEGVDITSIQRDWAKYVCNVDRGFTTLVPSQPVTPYSLFMMRMHLLRKVLPDNANEASRLILQSGFDFLDTAFSWMNSGGSLEMPESFQSIGAFANEISAISKDHSDYSKDIKRAEKGRYILPKKDGSGLEEVAGLWIEKPASAMFKSWARGDCENSGDKDGFVFLGIQVSDNRFILSVDPSSGVYLKGLGDLLELPEIAKRKSLGLERKGKNRPGYNSPDPWYDGRSPLHNYTIVDSPKAGTVLQMIEIQSIVRNCIQKS